MTTEALEASRVVPLPVAGAFDLFTARFGDWWPREFSWSGAQALERIGIEPRLGGALYEIGPHGLRWDWGRVLEWRPPARLGFSWQIGPDRVPVPDVASASRVHVSFTGEAGGTTVTVEHGDWDRHGPGAAEYRDAFAQVWPYALERLTALADGTGSAE